MAPPGSLGECLAARARDRIYDDFLRLCRPQADETILDVGVSDVVGDAANVLERHYPHPEQITAAGLGDGNEFRAAFPRVCYQRIVANERLPFADSMFAIASSNAVLEHAGSPANQAAFVAELLRVAGCVFLTVPNRYFPVEHHTAIPFLHWTDASFALACRVRGKVFWAQTENLILMSRQRLSAAAPPGRHTKIGNTGLLLGPWSSNLYLYAERN